MAVGTKKSVMISAIQTKPITRIDSNGGGLNIQTDKLAILTTDIDDVGDKNLIHVLPSNAKVSSLRIFSDDLDSNGTPLLAFNVGIYYLKDNIVNGVAMVSETVVDADCIGTAVTIGRAADVVGTEYRFEAADITSIDQELWQLAGLTADCGGLLAVGLTVSAVAATGVAGDIVSVVHWFN